jgi:hypothetical protein
MQQISMPRTTTGESATSIIPERCFDNDAFPDNSMQPLSDLPGKHQCQDRDCGDSAIIFAT